MSDILAGISLNITADDISAEKLPNKVKWMFCFALSTIAWSYIMVEMVFTYRQMADWVRVVLTGFYATLYAAGFVLATSFLSAVFMSGKQFSLGKAFYFATLANLSVLVIAVTSVLMRVQWGAIQILGHFPEHPLILGGYLTVLSQVRLVALQRRWGAMVCLFVMTAAVYVLLGPLMFNLFKL